MVYPNASSSLSFIHQGLQCFTVVPNLKSPPLRFMCDGELGFSFFQVDFCSIILVEIVADSSETIIQVCWPKHDSPPQSVLDSLRGNTSYPYAPLGLCLYPV